MMFTTLTLNIQNGLPWNEVEADDGQIDLLKTVDFLKGQDADVVFLQEVEMGHDGGAQIEPPPNFSSLRAALPGYDAVFGYPLKNDTELPFGLGLAIFSKTKLKNPMRMDLPAPDIEFEFDGTKRKPSSRLLIGATTVFGGRDDADEYPFAGVFHDWGLKHAASGTAGCRRKGPGPDSWADASRR